jgi:hypothetical protein
MYLPTKRELAASAEADPYYSSGYDLGHESIYPEGGYFQHDEPPVEPQIDPGLWALVKRYGSALGDMAGEEWEAAKARGAKQNAIDYAKGAASNVPMLVGMPSDSLALFRQALPPTESANPYANSIRSLLNKYLGEDEDKPFLGSEYLMDKSKDAGLDLEGEGLGYQAGSLLGLVGVGGLLRHGVRRLRRPFPLQEPLRWPVY